MVKGKEVAKEVKFRKANFGKGPRFYVKGVFTGFRRNKVWVLNNQAILKLCKNFAKTNPLFPCAERILPQIVLYPSFAL